MEKFLKHLRLVIICIAVLALIVVGFIIYKKYEAKKQNDKAVVTAIKSLNRWETASFSVEKIIDNGNSGNVFQQFLFGNRILLIAHGEVIGGFDMSNISDKSIKTSGGSITIDLPKPQILSTTLNEDQTRVYDRQKGLLVPTDNNLESQARASAVAAIHQAACSGGILDTTAENAKKQLTTILSSFKFTDITINIPKGSC